MPELTIVERARSFGGSIAVSQANHHLTYRDLVAHSQRIARRLLGDGRDLDEQRVALLCLGGQDFATSQWGVWRAGGICVPLSLSATESELEYAILDSQATIAIASLATAHKLLPVCSRLGIQVLLNNAESDEISHVPPLPEMDPHRRAMILYTSGTTSKPKGVVTTHLNIESQVRSLVEAWQWQAEDRIALFLPLHHIHGIINVLSCGLWSGARIHAYEAFDVGQLLEDVAQGRYTLFMAVPTIYFKLIQAIETAAPEAREAWLAGFAKMRLMVSGSAALPASVFEQWRALTGQTLLERYGMTEIGMALSNPLQGQRRAGSVGVPLPNVNVRLKSDTGEVIDREDTPGEIQVRGPTVFREYWNCPQATADSFDEGWFCTGDMAVVERGYYRIMGRLSVDIIKSGGYKLSALEIEEVLLQHPSIAQCAVVGLPDETWGEAVAAAVVLKTSQHMELHELRTWCRDRLSPYKIPKRLLVVLELPRNAMGKVVKPEIARLYKS